MKKNIIYILLLVLIMSVSTGCKTEKTGDNEIMEEDNTSSENTLTESDSQDVNQDDKESSNDTTEIKNKDDESKEEESKESGETESENTENKNKETENKETENRETENKETGDKGTRNKGTENKGTGNKGTGNKGTGNKETGNKETGNKGTGNKETGNKETGNKETGDNKETGNKETGNKGNGNKETGDKETENSKDNDKQDTADKDLLKIIDKIYEIKEPGLKLANTLIDLSNTDSIKYYTGLSDSSKIKEIAASETMIGSQAYSLVLVQLNDASDAEKVAKDMLNGIDPRKWICVGADDLQVVSHDDVIMLFMVSSTLEEKVTSRQIVDAFKEVCDGKLDIELKK
jgi:hypothetical protein